MAFSISEFNSKIHDHGLAKNNLFFVRIGLPPALLGELSQIPVSRDLEFFCKSVTLPEMDITTADVQPQGFGPNVRRPSGMQFPVLPATFMVDANFGVLKMFHRWTQAIVNYDRSGGNLAGVDNALPFELGYKDEYATTMQVAVYSHSSRSVEYVYEFSGVYPVNVGNVTASWENQAEVMTLPVGFTYDQLKVTGAKSGEVLADKPGSNTGRFLRWFSSINSIVNTLESIQRPVNVQDAFNQVSNVGTILNSFK
tara:strand:+ start:154 stop:915 length:762 start_codon:yes stop_codon:yes gene_type:complete